MALRLIAPHTTWPITSKWIRLATLSLLVNSMEATDKQSSAIKALIHLMSIKTSLFNIPLSAGAMKIAIFQ
jgi:hypothetical protein